MRGANYTIRSSPEKATRDIKLVAALTAFGIPLDSVPCLPTINRHGNEVWEFRIGPGTMDGKYKTEEVIAWWRDDCFVMRNPDHPFAYIKAALQNHTSLVDAIHGIRPLAQIVEGQSVALIHVDAPAKTEEIILGGLR